MQNYLTPHCLKSLQQLSGILGKNLVFVDLETTGYVHDPNFAIIEIGLISVSPNRIQEHCTLIDPQTKIPSNITALTGITNSMVRGKQTFEKYAHYFNKIAESSILMGFNSKSFDSKGLEKMGQKYYKYYKFKNQLDIRYLFIRERNRRLGIKGMHGNLTEASKSHGIYLSGNAHRAGYDIALTALVGEKILNQHGLAIIKEDINKIDCSLTKEKYFNGLSPLKQP